jgi:hypothetical protein
LYLASFGRRRGKLRDGLTVTPDDYFLPVFHRADEFSQAILASAMLTSTVQ